MSLLIDILNRASILALDLDPEGKQKLQPLRGKILCLQLTEPRLTLYLQPTEKGLEISDAMDDSAARKGQADVTLSGTAMDFMRLGRPDTDAVTQGSIHINGDVETGQNFQKALSQLDLDWEELLARYIGDTPARKTANTIRGLGGWTVETMRLCRENLADYLVEEARLLPSKPALSRFAQANNELRRCVDRAEQRLAKIDQRIGKPIGKHAENPIENPAEKHPANPAKNPTKNPTKNPPTDA